MTRPTGKGWLLFFVCVGVASLPIWNEARLIYVFGGSVVLLLTGVGLRGLHEFVAASEAAKSGQGR